MATENRNPLGTCVIGHVDSGKSTIVGHLSMLFGTTDKRTFSKLQAEADKRGKGSFSFAFVCDTLSAERDRGITIKTNLIKLEFPNRVVNVMDCPGHKDFIKNMVTGTAQADLAIAVVPCARGEFETAISGGTLREHVLIAGVFGVRRLIIAVNKVDTVPVDEQEARFNEVVSEMKSIVRTCHPDKDPICIPVSGIKGTGLANSCAEKFEWFKGHTVKGYDKKIFTLEDAINSVEDIERNVKDACRAACNDVITIGGIGQVGTGQQLKGVLNVGDQIVAQPSGLEGEVKTLEIHRKAVSTVFPGENFGFSLKVTKGNMKDMKKSGNILCNKKQDVIDVGYAYLADMVNIGHDRITNKYSPTMAVFTNAGPVQCVKFLSACSLKNKEVKHDCPEVITKNFKFEVILKPLGSLKFVAEPYTITPQLGRCALRDGGKIVAVGQIKKILTAEECKAFGVAVDDGKKAAAPAAKNAPKKK